MLADHDGVPAFDPVTETRDFYTILESAKILLVSPDSDYGSLQSQKHTGSGIFGNADFVGSAFCSASWRCFDPRSLDLLGAEVVIHHSRYQDVEKVKLPSSVKRPKP